MLDAHKGLYTLAGNSPLQLTVHMSDTALTIGAFKPSSANAPLVGFQAIAEEITSPKDEKSRAGWVISRFIGDIVSDIPGSEERWAYLGAATLDLTGHHGGDELVDFSSLIFTATRDGKLNSWINRLIDSRQDKNEMGTRLRAKGDLLSLAMVWLPVNTGSLKDARITILHGAKPVLFLGETPAASALDPTVFVSNAQRYRDYFWRADAPAGLTVPSDGSINVPIQLLENMDGSPLAHATKLKLEEVSGYAPKKRITTAPDGTAAVTLLALGLSPGEQIDMKINTDHYSGVGRIKVDVV